LKSKSLLVAAPIVALAISCNAVTGVDDLNVAGGSQGAGGSSGQGGGDVTSGVNPGPMMVAAQGVSITQIAIYQGVKRTLMGGTPDNMVVPIIAGRDALLRVFVATDPSYDGSPVTAHLFLGDGAAPLEIVAPVPAQSSEAQLGSTINFEIPGSAMALGSSYRVELTQPSTNSAGNNPNASFPASGNAGLDVISDGPSLKVVIVPIVYAADGSNRLPDTSPSQIQGYKDAFYAVYPIQSIDLTVRAQPFTWTQTVDSSGYGWDTLLDAIASLRQQDKAAANVYYFGAFAPDTSINQYCYQGCVAGLGMIGGPSDTYSRAAIGLGFSGKDAFDTAIHEIGHTQGRQHAPCGGAQGVDPGFPYSDGGIGAWGYDLVNKQLVSPNVATDLMGYCSNYWISDYTFKAIFQRIKTVNKAKKVYPKELLNRTWERARVGADGKLSSLPPVAMELPPEGEATAVTVSTAAGSTAVNGQFFPYDHLPGGVLLWPAGASATTSIEASIDGKKVTLSP
jgi:hypothetical protein